jgi:hypothetical protein
MIRFYQGSGSGEIDLLEPAFPSADWERLKNTAVRLMERKGHTTGADLLRAHPFQLHHGTNGFGDEFLVLYFKAPMAAYIDLTELAGEPNVQHGFRLVAQALGEIGQHVRFIAMELDDAEGPAPVPPPSTLITSDVVERALRDAERLIAGEGATSGVDRVHTAFHGYLKAVATNAGLSVPERAEIRELYKLIREKHPAFQQARLQQTELDKILRSLAGIVETLNPLRNQASVAHPNAELLEEPEAMLAINSVRTLMHYINARTNV